MQEQSLIEPFEEQFDLPPGSKQLDHVEGGPLLLRQSRPQQHHPCPPGWGQTGLRSFFVSDAFLFASSGLHRLLARRQRDDQTKLKTLLVLGIPNPGRVLTHRPILLMLDQALEIDLLAIFALQAYSVVAEPMHSPGSLSQSLLDTAPQAIAGIGDDHVAFVQGHMKESRGTVSVAHLHRLQVASS